MQMFVAGMISTDNALSLPTAMSNFVPPLITIGDHIQVPRSPVQSLLISWSLRSLTHWRTLTALMMDYLCLSCHWLVNIL